MYINGLGASASVSVSASAGGSSHGSSGGGGSSGPTPACVSAGEKYVAGLQCHTWNIRSACATADAPLCPNPAEVPGEPPPPPPPPPKAPGQFTGRTVVTGGGYGTKLPVPAATAVPVAPSAPLPPPDEGLPTWLWVAGGAAVLGGAAFFFARKKKGAA